MFTQLVVTGRSRLALYLARIPAGIAIIVPMVAIVFTVICAVCVFSAPTTYSFQGVTVPLGLSQTGYEKWAVGHRDLIICDLPFSGPCNGSTQPTAPLTKAQAVEGARQDYPSYSQTFLYPSTGVMVRTGLWVELQAVVWFIVGLGLASVLGDRTVALVLMIVFELVVSPILLLIGKGGGVPVLTNVQRGGSTWLWTTWSRALWVSSWPASWEPDRAKSMIASMLPPESKIVAVVVIAAWLVGWTALGARRMMTRDA